MVGAALELPFNQRYALKVSLFLSFFLAKWEVIAFCIESCGGGGGGGALLLLVVNFL